MIIIADRYLRALNDFCQMPPILINIKFTKLKTKKYLQAQQIITSGIPEYRGVKKLGERQIIHRWNRNDV